MATKILTLRLEGEVLSRCIEFQRKHLMENPSDAIRALLEIALRDVGQLDEAFRRAAWHTGVKKSRLVLQKKMDALIADCLGLTDTEIAEVLADVRKG